MTRFDILKFPIENCVTEVSSWFKAIIDAFVPSQKYQVKQQFSLWLTSYNNKVPWMMLVCLRKEQEVNYNSVYSFYKMTSFSYTKYLLFACMTMYECFHKCFCLIYRTNVLCPFKSLLYFYTYLYLLNILFYL